MNLQGRNLSLQTPPLQGADVALLQHELRQLGYTIADAESAGNTFGRATRQAVIAFQRVHRLPATGIVDEPTAVRINAAVDALRPLLVKGHVRRTNGRPYPGATVRAFDKDLRSEEELGRTTTDELGRYQIRYATNMFSRTEKRSADLRVAVFNTDESESVSSTVLYNAPPIATVDLMVGGALYREPSEYEALLAALTPIAQGLEPAAWVEDERHQDFTFLAQETGQSRVRIGWLAWAHQLAASTDVPPPIFYGLFRQGLSTNLHVLLLQPSRILQAALTQAVAQNRIPNLSEQQIDAMVTSLATLRGSRLFQGEDRPDFALRDLLEAAGASSQAQQIFVTRRLAHEGSPQEFWDALRQEPLFQQDGLVDNIEFALRMNVITGSNRKLVQTLQERRRSGELRSARDLVRLTTQDWEALIAAGSNGQALAFPVDVPGESETERITNYARFLVESLHLFLPMAHVAEGVARPPLVDGHLVHQLLIDNPNFDPTATPSDDFRWDSVPVADRKKAAASLEALRRELRIFPDLASKNYRSALAQGTAWNPLRQALVRFFDNVPDFDFREVGVQEYVQSNPQALDGIEDRDVTVAQLKRLQRVYLVAPRYEHAEALMSAGFYSAGAIASAPLNSFVRDMGLLLGGDQSARAVHIRAQKKYGVITQVVTALQGNYSSSVPVVVGGSKESAIKEVPSLAELFGSFDSCACAHCRSVYGPAAYFVDILEFLRKGAYAAYNGLLIRRPDLRHIKLTCANTDTPLPYVDLVNEILESCVALGNGQLNASTAKNTENIDAETLAVNPQYVIEAAYQKLLEKVHSFHLPYHRPIEVARAYLEHMGSSRHQVMATLQSHGVPLAGNPSEGPVDPDSQTPTALALACEYLKLSPDEYEILVNTSGALQAHHFFGYPDNMAPNLWRQDVAHVPEFLRRTGISYEDLVELLKTRFVNSVQSEPFPPQTIILASPDGVCDLEQTRIQHLAAPQALDGTEWLRLHRFLRLWKKLGWSIRELDAALHSLNAQEIDRAMLENLARLQELRLALDAPIIPLVSLWSTINTFDAQGEWPSLYDQLFQNQAVLNDPTDISFASLALDPTRTQLADTSQFLWKHTAALRAALRLTDTELALLRQAALLDADTAPMSLASLSALYRHALLARTLKLKVREYVPLLILAGVNGENPFTPASAVEFVARVREVNDSGFPILHLNYLLRHVTDPTESLAPVEQNVLALLHKIQEDLRKIIDQTTPGADPDGNLLREKLGLAFDPARLETAVQILDRISPLNAAEQLAFIQQNFAAFLAVTDADDLLALTVEQRRKLLYPRLLAHLRVALSRSLVKQALADALQLQPAIVQVLLEKAIHSIAAPNTPSIADFLALVGDGLTAHFFPSKIFGPNDVGGSPRIDAQVNFYWGDHTPTGQPMPPAGFGARWTGLLLAPHSEGFTFYVRAKDGVRLWVDNMAVAQIDHWVDQPQPVEHASAVVTLKAGQVYTIQLDYYASEPGGLVELSWSSLSTPKTLIPQYQLYTGINFVPLSSLVTSYARLHKATLLINGLALSAEAVDHLADHGDDFRGFDLNAWPMTRVAADPVDAAAPALFRQWEALRDLARLGQWLPVGEIALLTVLSATSALSAAAQLAALAGWDAADAAFLVGALDLPDALFKRALGPGRLAAAFDLAQRLGVSVVKLHGWANQHPNETQAQEIVRSLKAHYDDETWRIIAKSLNDTLRERQRDALVAYLLADPHIVGKKIRDADGLYEYFLIDVSMGACMMTSRIKQAISSVQLFIQRCFLNLELGISPDHLDENRWKWMRNYRVWEANRKIFLYPENWIEPELRDDKTPIFRELETQLLQTELSPVSVERALMGYLEQLDAVARLEILAIYHHVEGLGAEKTDEVHLFGRTQNEPPRHYYRRYIVRTGVWTAWEKLSLEIDSRHLIPVVWNRRLYLYWATFVEKPNPEQDLSGPSLFDQESKVYENQYTEKMAVYEEDLKKYDDYLKAVDLWEEMDAKLKQITAQAPFTIYTPFPPFVIYHNGSPGTGLGPIPEHLIVKEPVKPPYNPPVAPEPEPPVMDWEIKLSWSEYREGRWSAKQTGKDAIITYMTGDQHDIRFQLEFNYDGELLIACLRRTADTHDYRDDVKRVGRFYLPGCGNKLDANNASTSYYPQITPHRSRIAAQRFNQEEGNTLIFYGPAQNEFPVFKKTLTPYRLAHPPHDIEPLAGGFAKAVYPLAYQDTYHTYLGLPVRDTLQAVNFMPTYSLPRESIMISELELFGRDSPFFASAAVFAAQTHDAAQPDGQLQLAQPLTPAFGPAPSPIETSTQSRDLADMAYAGPDVVAAALYTYLKFYNLFHPFVCEFMKHLNWKGISGLYDRSLQQRSNDPSPNQTLFAKTYQPTTYVHNIYPKEMVDFDGGAYSVYNWELFFHAPLLIATRLSQEGRFQEAQSWFHRIFNPTTNEAGNSPQRYWITRPFYENSDPEQEQIVAILKALHSPKAADRDEVKFQIEQWRDNPFKPHLIARLRITAYQKTVVMKYIDNLIAWGDDLFRRDTIESINEATQLYVLASRLLGRRPQQIRRQVAQDAPNSELTYFQLLPTLDTFSNALIELESTFPFAVDDSGEGETGAATTGSLGTYPDFYFCIPHNEKLLGYWDTVEDRLFKIRHCLNIEGLARSLPLFEPPIDPALLVKAVAMGLDIASVLSEINAPLPPYRFQTLVQKALELCQELKALGGALLSALEKKDAEQLALLRAGHELTLLKAARDVRRGQLQEAEAALLALQKTRDVVATRHQYYDNLLKAGLSFYEQDHLDRLKSANDKQGAALDYDLMAQGTSMIPNTSLGTSGWSSPVNYFTLGGSNISMANSAYARYLNGEAADETYKATKSSITGGHQRREQEWRHQLNLAAKELLQIDQQIVGTQIRSAVAERELINHDTQTTNAAEIATQLAEKYTNQDLYGWMAGQISWVFHETYKLAYDLAKRAERAYRFERGLAASNFIQFGLWDSVRKGLLSGEQLALDLKRMETAYMDQHRREYEIRKQISLALLDPEALLYLKQTGRCRFSLPEALFDLDFPGHYMRRLRSINLTIPCVAGPFSGIHATLTLLSSTFRVDPNAQRPYAPEERQDARFITNYGALQSIATSNAIEDSGLFELNFRDERYLPFEGAGAVSVWQLDMPTATNDFDLDTVSDVILRINYTAREGGELLRQTALAAAALPSPQLQDMASITLTLKAPAQTSLRRLFSAKHEFPSEWHRFLHPLDLETEHTLTLGLASERFPFRYRNMKIEINRIEVFLKLKKGVKYEGGINLVLDFAQVGGSTFPDKSLLTHPVLRLPHGVVFDNDQATTDTWTVTIAEEDLPVVHPALRKMVTLNGQDRWRLVPQAIDDLWILVTYNAA